MTLVRLDNVSRFYGANEVLVDLSCQVEEGERIGLIGPNGCGKTTLARLIAGELEPDRGAIHRKKGLSVGYLAQEAEVEPGVTVLEATLTAFQDLLALHEDLAAIERRMAAGDHSEATLSRYGRLRDLYEKRGGYAFEREAKTALFGLGFREEDLSRPAEVLSGGQKSRLALARLLVRRPELLVLDEPTNHLDLQATEWLEGFLSACAGAVILISHDRYFLDRTVAQIAEIERRKLVLYPGGYTAYAAEKQRRVEQQRKLYEAQQVLIERTSEFIRRNLAGQKTRQAQSRRKMLEKLERIDRPAANGRGARFNLSGSERGGDHVLGAEGIAKSYDARTLFRDVTFTLRRGDRMGIVGPNGAGKTTLLKILAGRLPKDRGEVLLGRRVSVGYYDQERAGLNPDSTVLEEIRSIKPPEKDEVLRTFLGRFLFSGDEVHQVIGTLSGGEQSRVALAKLIFARPNLLLLDEPTNHLDIRSRTALEDALSDFDGTILTVSHDRYFLNRIARSILCLDGESWGVYGGDSRAYAKAGSPGSNDELRMTNDESTNKKIDIRHSTFDIHSIQKPETQAATKAERKALYEQARRTDRERERRERRVAQIGEEIMSLGGQILALDEEMSGPEVAADWGRLGDLSQRRAQLKAAVDRLYEEWAKMEREEEGLGCA